MSDWQWMPIWMSLMNLFLLMLRQLSCSHDIHRSFSKVLCVCIFDELHHKQRVCSLLKSKNFDITVDVAKMFIICDKKMTCHEYVFFLLLAAVYVYVSSMKPFQNEFISCWHCNYFKMHQHFKSFFWEFNLIQFFNQSKWHFSL